MKIFAPVRIPTPGQGISDALNFSPRGNANKLCKFTSRWLVSFLWRIYLADWVDFFEGNIHIWMVESHNIQQKQSLEYIEL